jgi:hypothetical protein
MAKPGLTDALLIKMVLTGDSEKFEILIKKYSAPLYKIARAFNLNHTEAEALMEITFVNAYKNLNHLQEKKRFKSFLIGMMLHECASKNKNTLPVKVLTLTVFSAEFLSKSLTGCFLIPWGQVCFLPDFLS